jgi:gamma-glutamylcyclotransferase (GGCT)/AIG2-like uncharacterized protein YtfP
VKKEYLFVYGTLRRGQGNEFFDVLARGARFVGDASTQARMYAIGDYPGAVPSTDTRDRVRGELFELSSGDVLRLLDKYEECAPDDPDPKPFVRSKIDVSMEDGRTVTAWAYLYNLDVSSKARIPSGDYADHIRERKPPIGPGEY